MLKKLGIAAVAALVIGAGTASAAPVYDTSALAELTGSRSTPAASGIVISGGNATAASIAWVITQFGSSYKYSYSFSEDSPQGISHFVLDLSDNCTSTSACVTQEIVSGSYKLVYGTYTVANGNPNFPGNIYGVKFDDLTSSNPFTFSFFSSRKPVYGDFYAKGGNGDTNGFAVYNTGAANHTSSAVSDFIARPDSLDIVVPEPASVLLLGAGLIGLAARLRRRQ